jgi:hypothetical protein
VEGGSGVGVVDPDQEAGGGGGGEDEDEARGGWMDGSRASERGLGFGLGCLASTKSRRISPSPILSPLSPCPVGQPSPASCTQPLLGRVWLRFVKV